MFEHSGVDPGNALVIDDSADNLDRAVSVGAATCRVSAAAPAASGSSHRVISSLAGLPELLDMS